MVGDITAAVLLVIFHSLFHPRSLMLGYFLKIIRVFLLADTRDDFGLSPGSAMKDLVEPRKGAMDVVTDLSAPFHWKKRILWESERKWRWRIKRKGNKWEMAHISKVLMYHLRTLWRYYRYFCHYISRTIGFLPKLVLVFFCFFAKSNLFFSPSISSFGDKMRMISSVRK